MTPSGPVPVGISVVPTGVGAPAAVLRLTDLRPERALQARLDQAQRLQAVGELAGGIAHDFNNLLTAIAGAAEDLGSHVAAAGQEDLAQIRGSAARGAALVRQLLAFGGQQTLQPRVLALNDAVRDAASLLARLLGPGVVLTLALEEPGRMVKVDPTQLDQVLVNLAVNARDAMPGGGTLTIATGHRLLLQPETADGQDPAARALCNAGGARYRPRHSAGGVAAHFRAVLHDQAGRGWHGPWAVHGARHRPPVRRLPVGAQHGRAGYRVLHHAAAARKPDCRRRAPRRRRRRTRRRRTAKFCCWWRTSRRCAGWPRGRCGAAAGKWWRLLAAARHWICQQPRWRWWYRT